MGKGMLQTLLPSRNNLLTPVQGPTSFTLLIQRSARHIRTPQSTTNNKQWASGDQFSASAGSGVNPKKSASGANFRRLPFNFCAVSLQPFSHPVCTSDGIIFDLTNILPWLKKHGTNPIDGKPLSAAELIKLHFAKNDDNEYVDPVTYKAFTDNTHIVALKVSGNVFAWDTVERLNIKAKSWRDLVSDQEFSRKDIITLQDPQNLGARDLSRFKFLKDGASTLTEEQQAERMDPTNNLNLAAMGSSAKILKAKEAVARARAERAAGTVAVSGANGNVGTKQKQSANTNLHKKLPVNAASHTSGLAAASFTSTGVTPHTSNERALLSEEEFLLKPRRVKQKGYARLQTTAGDLAVELNTEFAPRAVWNFVKLAKRGYYNGVSFHRSIRNFMLQGGDPTGTGRGGSSVWGKPFADEWSQSPLKHDARGVISMANKGKNTNTSQFFVTYRAASHLDRKHTIFGRVILEDPGGESEATLKRLEGLETDSADRPVEHCKIETIDVYVDPFEEFLKEKEVSDTKAAEDEQVKMNGGTEDDKVTWTGKRVRRDGTVDEQSGEPVQVGKYLDAKKLSTGPARDDDFVEIVDESWAPAQDHNSPPTKKRKAGGFGNFDAW